MEAKNPPNVILITGASSGLGRALAVEYAAPSRTLLLFGRNEARLNETASLCTAKGAQVRVAPVDVTDQFKMAARINDFDASYKIDLVIANAGISAGTGGGTENADQVRKIFNTNVNGVLNTVLPMIPRLKAKGGGQIAIISSLAGYRGMPGAPAYSASKAAVKAWGEGLRPDLRQHNIRVSVVCPGFVETPMTAINNFTMPFMLKPEKAAAIIRKGLERNKARIAFPFPMVRFIGLVAALPPHWTDGFLAKAPKKG
jgi:short-subunit dehydrogenase